MKFLVDIEIEPEDEDRVITQEQFREHMQSYTFAYDCAFELSLIPNDPDHESATSAADYVTYTVSRVNVESVPDEVTSLDR